MQSCLLLWRRAFVAQNCFCCFQSWSGSETPACKLLCWVPDPALGKGMKALANRAVTPLCALLTSLPSCFNASESILITNFTKLYITYLCSWSIRTKLLCNVLQFTGFQGPSFLLLYLLLLPAPGCGTLNAQYPGPRASNTVFMPCCLGSRNERGKAEPVPTACSAPLKLCQRRRVMGKSSPCLGAEILSGFM